MGGECSRSGKRFVAPALTVAWMVHYVYVVECSDGTLYTGYTTDVGRRIDEHNAGDGAKYTAGRRPVTPRYVEYHPDRSAAQRREYRIKNRSRAAKERLLPDADGRVVIDLSGLDTDER